MSSGDGIGDRNVIFIRDHLLDRDLEIWKGCAEAGKELDKAFWAATLIRRRIVIFNVRRKYLVQLLQLTLVDRFTHLLCCLKVRLLTHTVLHSLAFRCKAHTSRSGHISLPRDTFVLPRSRVTVPRDIESAVRGFFSQPRRRRGTLIAVSVEDLIAILGRASSRGLVAALLCAGAASGQTGSVPAAPSADLPIAPSPTSDAIRVYEQSLPADIHVLQASTAPLPLGLDEAIRRGLNNNLQIELRRQNENRVKGLQSTAVNALLPSLVATGQTNTQEINLAAMGFKPQSIGPLLGQFGGGAGSTFATIVKVSTTGAQLNLKQQVFNVPAYFLYRAAQKAGSVANFETLNTRGGIALQVGSQYLRVLADAAQVENARAQVQSDQLAFEQARDRQRAGVGIHLDTLRAQVQLQGQQQSLIAAETTLAKDRIQLNRLMGTAVDQQVILTDTTPFADLTMLQANETVSYAFTKRKDLLSLESQMEVARQTERAVRYERLPTVAVNGFYGVLGQTRGLYHGVFTAQGSVNFPIFKEAQFRGEAEVARAQLMGLRQQIDSLRITIDQQIRSSLLDVQSSNDLVKVARSNVDLSRQELADAVERFRAGVSDNLPVVQAQGTLAASESQLVEQLFQYNLSKLQLARSVGVVESEYKIYLGR